MSNQPETVTGLDPTMRVKTLIALTQELTAIFVEENASLKARRPADMAALQSDKARLAAAYAQSIRQIAQDRGLVDGAGDVLLEQLKDITRIFEQRASEQRALLGGAQAASEKVLRAVSDEAAAGAAPATYSDAGREAGDKPVSATPLAVNEQI